MGDTTPIVCFRTDDVHDSWLEEYDALGGVSALAYAKALRIPITFSAESANMLNTEVDRLRYTDYIDYLKAVPTAEVASHGTDGQPGDDDDAAIADLKACRFALERYIPGLRCRSFVQSGAWGTTAETKEAGAVLAVSDLAEGAGLYITQLHDVSMAYLPEAFRVGTVHYRYGSAVDDSIDQAPAAAVSNLATALSLLDMVADSPGAIWVPYGHGLQADDGTTDYRMRVSTFKAYMDHLARLRDLGRIRLMGITQAFMTEIPDDGLNHVPDGNFRWTGTIGNATSHKAWRGSNAVFEAGQGRNGEVGMKLPNSAYAYCRMQLQPAEYEISFWARINSAISANKKMLFIVSSTTNHATRYVNRELQNAFGNSYERHSVRVRVPDGQPVTNIYLAGQDGSGWHISDVQCVKVRD